MYIYIVYIYIHNTFLWVLYTEKSIYLYKSLPEGFDPIAFFALEDDHDGNWMSYDLGCTSYCNSFLVCGNEARFFLGPNLTIFKHFDGDPIQLMFLILEELSSSKRGVHPKEALRVDAMDFFRSVCSMSVDTFLLNFLGHMSMIFSSPSISIKVLVKSS